MTDGYKRYRRQARQELADFIKERGFRAYSDETYRKELARLGISPEEADSVLTEDPIGEYTITAKIPEIEAKKKELEDRKRKLIAADPDGSNFIYEMFLTENLETGYRNLDEDIDPGDFIITVTGLTPQEVRDNPKLSYGLKLALRKLDNWDPCKEYRAIWNSRARELCHLPDELDDSFRNEICEKYDAEIRKGIDHDIDGSGFIRGMILFEGKDEFFKDLRSLGYDMDEVDRDERIRNGLALAEYLRDNDW